MPAKILWVRTYNIALILESVEKSNVKEVPLVLPYTPRLTEVKKRSLVYYSR
jgi:hypothetical protein